MNIFLSINPERSIILFQDKDLIKFLGKYKRNNLGQNIPNNQEWKYYYVNLQDKVYGTSTWIVDKEISEAFIPISIMKCLRLL